eukprot:7751390-Lingulodinium_polyedra.AAC.1
MQMVCHGPGVLCSGVTAPGSRQFAVCRNANGGVVCQAPGPRGTCRWEAGSRQGPVRSPAGQRPTRLLGSDARRDERSVLPPVRCCPQGHRPACCLVRLCGTVDLGARRYGSATGELGQFQPRFGRRAQDPREVTTAP